MKNAALFATCLAAAAWMSACKGEIAPDPAPQARARDAKTGCYAGTKGAAMVRVTWPDGRAFCVDQRAATQAEFAAFVADVRPAAKMAGPPLSHPMGETCAAWVDPVVPASKLDQFPTCGKYYDPVATPDRPMVCLDWCAAYAFCAWSGKRLCGHSGGVVDFDRVPEGSELNFVCTNGGKDEYQVDPALHPECTTSVAAYDLGFPPAECVGSSPPFDQISPVTGAISVVADECYVVESMPQGIVSRSPVCRSYGGVSSKGTRNCAVSAGIARRESSLQGVRCCSD